MVGEQHFRVNEVAKTLKLSPQTIRKLFRNEPGVLKISGVSSTKRKKHVTLLIPASVVARVMYRYATHRC